MTENEISTQVIGTDIEIHTALGPGLLESSYQHCLGHELKKSRFFIEEEKSMSLVFKEVILECGYRIDLLVEKKLVVEIKSVSEFKDIHLAQILTYLRMGNYKLGLLLNFNAVSMKDGIKRVVNRL